MKYVGMHTQIRRNNMLTAILLLMFPVIILGMVWVFLALVNYFGSGVYDQYGNIVRHLDADVVNHYFVNTIPWVIIGVGAWFLIAYFSNTAMVLFQHGNGARSYGGTSNNTQGEPEDLQHRRKPVHRMQHGHAENKHRQRPAA